MSAKNQHVISTTLEFKLIYAKTFLQLKRRTQSAHISNSKWWRHKSKSYQYNLKKMSAFKILISYLHVQEIWRSCVYFECLFLTDRTLAYFLGHPVYDFGHTAVSKIFQDKRTKYITKFCLEISIFHSFHLTPWF